MKALLILLLTVFAAQAVESFDPYAPTETVKSNRASGGANIPPEWLIPSKEPFRIGPGDKVEIEIFRGHRNRQVALLGPDGMLYFDLLTGFVASGMTLRELQDKLETMLSEFYRFPKVSVVVKEVRSKRVWVLGRVNTPGVYSLVRPTTVIDAIAQAGGLFTSRFSGTTEELADLDHSFVMRGRKLLPINFHRLLREGDMSQNIQLEPGDYIYLPSALTKEVHMLGAVKLPRPIGFNQEMSLTSAMGAVQGPAPGADLRNVAIVRGSLADPKIAIVDFEAIQQGRAQNVRLEPKDIVFVPTGRFRSLTQIADIITNTFARTVGANEGGRAAIQRSEPVRPQLNLSN